MGTAVFLLLGGRGLCHTARSRPHTLIWTGARPASDEALPRGIQAPSVGPADCCGGVEEEVSSVAVIDSDAAKIRVLEWVFGCLVVRKSGDDAASDGREVLGEGRKATVGASVATAANRAAEKGGADTILPTVEDEKMTRFSHSPARGDEARDLRGVTKRETPIVTETAWKWARQWRVTCVVHVE